MSALQEIESTSWAYDRIGKAFASPAVIPPRPINEIRDSLLNLITAPWVITTCTACQEDETLPGGARCTRCERRKYTAKDWE
jgi:hypothetical protein